MSKYLWKKKLEQYYSLVSILFTRKSSSDIVSVDLL